MCAAVVRQHTCAMLSCSAPHPFHKTPQQLCRPHRSPGLSPHFHFGPAPGLSQSHPPCCENSSNCNQCCLCTAPTHTRTHATLGSTYDCLMNKQRALLSIPKQQSTRLVACQYFSLHCRGAAPQGVSTRAPVKRRMHSGLLITTSNMSDVGSWDHRPQPKSIVLH